MSKARTPSLESRWGRLGVHFYAAPAKRSPDVELLLIETARELPRGARLISPVVTWLREYSDFVAKHRLKRLIMERTSGDQRAALGFLLESALELGGGKDLAIPLESCTPRVPGLPLLELQRNNRIFAVVAEETASPLSRKWGLWAPEIELKLDVIRPVWWLLKLNPALRSRIVRKGDLRASILEVLRLDVPGEVDSAAELGRLTGATRAAVGAALKALVLEGEVKIVPRATNKRDHRVVLLSAA